MDKRVWAYQELRAVPKLFDADLTRKEVHDLVGVLPQKDEGSVQHTLK